MFRQLQLQMHAEQIMTLGYGAMGDGECALMLRMLLDMHADAALFLNPRHTLGWVRVQARDLQDTEYLDFLQRYGVKHLW